MRTQWTPHQPYRSLERHRTRVKENLPVRDLRRSIEVAIAKLRLLVRMLYWNNKLKVIAALAAFGIYFALAGWAKVAYVDPTPAGEAVVQPTRLPRVPSGKIVVQLKRPFEPFGNAEHGRNVFVDTSQLVSRRRKTKQIVLCQGALDVTTCYSHACRIL